MKTYEGKIIEATEDELFSNYLRGGYDEIMSFRQFLDNCQRGGTEVLKSRESKTEEDIKAENETMFNFLSAIVSAWNIRDNDKMNINIKLAKMWIECGDTDES